MTRNPTPEEIADPGYIAKPIAADNIAYWDGEGWHIARTDDGCWYRWQVAARP